MNATELNETDKDDAEAQGASAASATAVPVTALPPTNDDDAAAPGAAPGAEPESRPAKRAGAAMDDPGLENLVRVADEDRWLATRFASKAQRRRLLALYALNIEVARIAERVSEPRLGEIRLQWWREAVEDVVRGGPVADHPTVRALAELVEEVDLPLALFDALLTARISDLSAAPFETWADLDAYIDATAGGLMRLSALICAPDLALTPQRQAGLQAMGRTWGFIGLLQALPLWIERGRTFYPANLRGALGLAGSQAQGDKEEAPYAFAAHAILDRAAGAQRQIARYAQVMPKEIFPAIGYAALAPLYLRMQFRKELGRPLATPSLFARQFKLVFAAATGKL